MKKKAKAKAAAKKQPNDTPEPVAPKAAARIFIKDKTPNANSI